MVGQYTTITTKQQEMPDTKLNKTVFNPIVGEKWAEEISRILFQTIRCFDSKGNYNILCKEPWKTIILSHKHKSVIKGCKHEILIEYRKGDSISGRHLVFFYTKATTYKIIDKRSCWKIFYLDSVKFSKKSIPKPLKLNEKYLLSTSILKSFQSISQ